MPTETFGPWLPDLPALGNPGVTIARNVFPAEVGYVPVPGPQAATSALDARPRGALRVRDNAGAGRSYAGDAAKLYELVDGVWTDRSISGGYATADGERWEFVRWGAKILATNFSDNPQTIDMGGTEFADLTSDFKCRHLAPMRNFVLAGNTTDSGDGEVRDRLRWCAFNDETDWTPDAATLADFEDLQTGGEIMGIRGGEFAVVFQAESIRRVLFVGSPTVMQIDEVLPGIGALARGGIVQDGRISYFLSQRGFLSLTDGTGVEAIGDSRVDKTVLADIDGSHLDRVSAARDPVSGRVFWAYPGAGNTAGRPNKIAVYDPRLKKFSLLELDVELLWSSGGVSISIDADDPGIANDNILDAVDISLDSARYKGAGSIFGYFSTDFRGGHFDSATPMANALIEAAEQDLGDGRRTRLKSHRMLVEGGTPPLSQIGTRNGLHEEVVYSAAFLPRSSGRAARRSNARYRRLRCLPQGSWRKAIGLQIARGELAQGGMR